MPRRQLIGHGRWADSTALHTIANATGNAGSCAEQSVGRARENLERLVTTKELATRWGLIPTPAEADSQGFPSGLQRDS